MDEETELDEISEETTSGGRDATTEENDEVRRADQERTERVVTSQALVPWIAMCLKDSTVSKPELFQR